MHKTATVTPAWVPTALANLRALGFKPMPASWPGRMRPKKCRGCATLRRRCSF